MYFCTILNEKIKNIIDMITLEEFNAKKGECISLIGKMIDYQGYSQSFENILEMVMKLEYDANKCDSDYSFMDGIVCCYKSLLR